MDDQEYAYLKRRILELTGIDLSSYKSQQMRRRLEGFVPRFEAPTIPQYCKRLEHDPAMLKALQDFLTINVSEFFRDRKRWQQLRTAVLPELLRRSPRLKLNPR